MAMFCGPIYAVYRSCAGRRDTDACRDVDDWRNRVCLHNYPYDDWERQCEAGDGIACIAAGNAYLSGYRIDLDCTKAAVLLHRGCVIGAGCEDLIKLKELGVDTTCVWPDLPHSRRSTRQFVDGPLESRCLTMPGAGEDIEFCVAIKGGMRSGPVSARYTPSQQVAASGEYQSGNRHGEWVFYHPKGVLAAKGTYVAGRRDGLWLFHYENGAKAADIRYQGSQLHIERMWYEGGQNRESMCWLDVGMPLLADQ